MEIHIPANLFIYLALSAILNLFHQTLADTPPIFRKEPSTEAVKQNSRVRIKCKVEPKDADVRWVFNGEDVAAGEGVTVRRGSLVIDEFTDELHQGSYQCIASNNAGAIISKEAYLQVAYIVNFPKTLPDRTYGRLGQIAVIDCQRPESLPPAQMEYFFNGALIVEDDHYRVMPSGRLHIIHPTLDDEGLYGCRAVNPVTSRAREQFNATQLEIIQDLDATTDNKPASISYVSGALFHVGDQAMLECVAEGIPYPNIRWQRSGAGALPETAVQHLGGLKINDVSMEDAGVYECLVDNSVGTPVIREVVLEVIELPAINKPPKSISVGLRGNAQFKCGVTGASEENITWMHNAIPVQLDNTRHYMVHAGTGGVQLLVMDITVAQLGVYQCIVRTKQGMDHAAAILKFREGYPRITRPPVNTTAIEGENVSMSCEASGDPPPEIGWFAPDGQPIVNSRRTILSRPHGRMTLKDVGLSDEGLYWCSASNNLGAVSATVYLHVLEKIVATPSPVPRKTIGKPLSSDDGNMTVENTEEPDKPGAVPDAPSKPDILKTSDTSVEVRWSHTDTTNTPLTRFTVEYRDIRLDPKWRIASSAVDPTSSSYEVHNLSPGGTYRFQVMAGNQYGDSAPSDMSNRFFLQASTPTVQPVRPPTGEVRITSSKAVSSSAIQVMWQYTPDIRFNTPIDGFYIYHRDTDSDDDRDYIRTPVVGAGATRYLIDKLEREVSYDIKMTSFNTGGTSRFSNVVIVATPAPETPITFIPGPVIPSPDTVPNDLGGSLPDDPMGPEANSPATGTNQDILYITLGVVLGAMLLVLIMFGVMCIWRAKQVNHERTERMDWRRGPGPYYDGSTYRYINSNGTAPHYKFHPINGANMNGGPHQGPNHVYTQGIGHLPFGETATAIDPQPMYPLTQNGMEERTLMLTSQPSISNGHGPYTSNGQINRPYNGQVQKVVPMLPRTSSEPARSGFTPARSREGALHSGSSSEHLHHHGNGSLRSYNSNSGPDAGTTSSRESGQSRSKRPKCPHRHPHKADVNKSVRRQPNEHPTSREGSISSSLDCASVEVSPPPTPTSSTAPPIHATVPPPRSDGMDSPHSRSRSSSNLSNASSSCRNVKHSDIF